MILKKAIRDKILGDIHLFYAVAVALDNKTPNATVRMLERNTSKNLESIKVIDSIKRITGLDQSKILK